MKKSMKKILSLVLVVMMCVSVAVPAFATETAATCPGGIDKDHFKTNCTYTKIDTYEPKCTERGYTVYQCDGCGKYFADDFVLNTEEHDYDVTKEATCTEKGTEVCSKCNDERDIPALVHDWTPDNNTCMAPDELVHQTCTRCDAERDVEATGIHDWVIEVVEKPTCGKDGKAVYTCRVCGYSKDVAIDYHTAEAGGHKWVFVEAVEMICKEGEERPGNTAGYKCSVCDTPAPVDTVVGEDEDGDPIVVKEDTFYEVIPVAHTEGAETPIDATCTTPAFIVTVCPKCQKTEMEPVEGSEPTGHNWTWDPDAVEVTACKYENGKFTPGKSTVQGTCSICTGTQTLVFEHKDSEDIEEDDELSIHIIVTENVATCMVGAYTEYDCDKCGHFETEKGEVDLEDGHNYKLIYPGAPNLTPAEEDLCNAATKAPTCTTAGKGFKACMNGCGMAIELVDIPALGHSYMKRDENGNLVKDENGNLVYDLDKAVKNCKTGKYEYVCEDVNCPVEKTPANEETDAGEYTEIVDIDGWKADDITCHKSWNAATNTWSGTKSIAQDNGCGRPAIWLYTCECGTPIMVIEENSHDEENATVKKDYKHVTCLVDGNYEMFVCADCGVYCYYDAEGKLVEVGTATEVNEMRTEWNEKFAAGEVEGAWVAPWIIPATGCDIVIDKVFIAPTCGKLGQSAGWHCANGDYCDVVNPWYDPEVYGEDDIYVDDTGSYVKVMDNSAETAKTLKGTMVFVELTTDHVFAPATVKHGASIAEVRTCSEYGYVRHDCANCDTWKWYNYKPETGHDVKTHEAECTVNGWKICENEWCEYRDYEDLDEDNVPALVFDTEKNPTYEVILSTGHKDADGKSIICVAEDFWCAECHPEPEEDSEPDPTYVKLKWYESHNTAAEAWREVWEEYELTATTAHGGMKPTVLNGTNDCTVWRYLLWVCPECEDDSKGGYFNDETAPCAEHVYIDYADDEDEEDVVYAASLNNLDKIPAAAYDLMPPIKPATFAEAGIKGVKCDRCAQPVATKEYVREDIGFDISIDSGVYAGAELVNSGKMKVTVLVNAWQVSLYSLNFEVEYNPNYFTYTGFELPEGSPFGKSGVYAAADGGEVEVYMANAGETLTNLNLDLKGTQKAVVVLVFDINDAVNASNLGTTSGTLTLNDARVLTAAETVVAVANDPNVETGKADDITKYSDNDAAYVIKALGNVTGGVIENTQERIDDFDALKWQALFINKKYLATADINKNGQLDAQDYEYLCTYIVDGMTYEALCAK